MVFALTTIKEIERGQKLLLFSKMYPAKILENKKINLKTGI